MTLSETSKLKKLPGISEILSKTGIDSFVFALGGMILLAWLLPSPGAYEGLVSLKSLANYGVSVVFFFYGLRLSPEKLQIGLSNWRLHMVVHISTFVLFPLLMLMFRFLFAEGDAGLLWLGAFYLSALPSTVSSSVVMVSIARGNMPAAIFNASLSSLIGVFITPLWMGLFIAVSSGGLNLWGVIGQLSLQVLVPVVLGIFLHRRWGSFAETHRKKLRHFDQSIILLIVYTSFCASFARQMFKDFSILNIFLLGICMVGLFFLAFSIITLVCKLLRFNREDSITALFCGSKKSLVHGTVMSRVLFPGSNVAGIILLPLMMYHALQLVAASIIAKRMAKFSEKVKG
ncbi:MAG: bile acid:sodium symporter family protein [Bacteroidota bacterium]|nr:bile acid:sodium symporter family protein [Bacteroidota bacterium]